MKDRLSKMIARAALSPNRSIELLAPLRHTRVFLTIVAILTTTGALSVAFSPADKAAPTSLELYFTYAFMIAAQLYWVRFVQQGMQKHGRSIREFFGEQKVGGSAIAIDAVAAITACALVFAISSGFASILPGARPELTGFLPKGAWQGSLWVCMAMIAGLCEEIIFRGYFQRQLEAITGRRALAVIGQAVVFGIAHSYQGLPATFVIVGAGLVFGALAAWRGNIRACILAHVALDMLAGVMGH